MTRIPEGLRSKLAREGKKNGRSMNAEIVYRLEQSFQQEDIIKTIKEAVVGDPTTKEIGGYFAVRDVLELFGIDPDKFKGEYKS
jgi:hypothetical protein